MIPFAVALAALAVAAPLDPDLPVTKLVVRPTAVPSPALRYKLLPEVRDRQPGNALTLYYKAFSPDLQHFRSYQDQLEAALELPADKLRADPGVRQYMPSRQLLELVDQAARRSYIEWDLVSGLRADGIGLLMPDAQSMRTFGLLLAVRARLDAADGKFDRAVSGLQTGFALARHMCEAPLLIHALIGAAVASQMLAQVEFLVQPPGAPNLYWALTDLPRPLIDLRAGLQGERVWVDWLAPGVRERVADPDTPPMTVEELRIIADRVARIEGNWDMARPVYPEARLAVSVLAAQRYPAAREWLMSRGWTAAQIDAIPVAQAALMYEIHDYDRLYDEALKWHAQPPTAVLTGLEEADRMLKRESAGADRAMMARLLLPATRKVYQASLRIDRRVAALRCVEAVRLYAAAHGGRLPATLADITEVPIPGDPATGRPFGYAVRGDTATLTAPAFQLPASAGNTFTYELTLAK